jgi:hypothetical protein
MKTRKNIARLFLFLSSIYWGIWLGGYIFNALMVVPTWNYNPPETIVSYYKARHMILYFFSAVNPWVFLVTLIAWLLTIKLDTGGRVWIGRATLLAWIMFPLKVFMIITIGGVHKAAMDGKFEAEMVDAITMWRNLNWVTIATATVILILHLVAILNFNNPRQIKKQTS